METLDGGFCEQAYGRDNSVAPSDVLMLNPKKLNPCGTIGKTLYRGNSPNLNNCHNLMIRGWSLIMHLMEPMDNAILPY